VAKITAEPRVSFVIFNVHTFGSVPFGNAKEVSSATLGEIFNETTTTNQIVYSYFNSV
jgi:hypothetical protein